jgi:hypothetical protein
MANKLLFNPVLVTAFEGSIEENIDCRIKMFLSLRIIQLK